MFVPNAVAMGPTVIAVVPSGVWASVVFVAELFVFAFEIGYLLLEVTDRAGDRREGSRVSSVTVVDTGNRRFVEFLNVVIYIGNGSG